MDMATLEKQVSEQGAVVRKLKTEKATQEEINEAINKLLALKGDLKEAEQTAVANLIEEIEKMKVENTDAEIVSKKEAELKELQLKVNPPPKEEKKVKAKKEEGPSKKELRKLKRAETVNDQKSEVTIVPAGEQFGDLPLIQSATKTDRVWTTLSAVESQVGQDVWIRGRIFNSNHKGKCCFILLRESFYTIQCALFQSKDIPKEMVSYAGKIPKESIIDIYGTVSPVPNPIDSASIKNFEISVKKIFVVTRLMVELPFTIDAACRSDDDNKKNDELAEENRKFVTVLPDTKLDYRWLDLRTPASQGIARIMSGIGQLFREYLYSKGFMEIHTPKICPGSSEGGSEVFKLDYFGTPCCLAQSPQLYKQMTTACSDFERVFELVHRYAKEMEAIKTQYPFEPLVYPESPVIIRYTDGMKMLQESGVAVDPMGDLSSTNEKLLGKLVRDKYNTDFYILDKFPLHIRPFYTMPDPVDKRFSNSFDIFIRGEEIVSGAQRIHDPELLKERAKAWGISIDSLKAYLQAFQHGAQPHAGCGVGLERVAMLFLNLGNVRRVSLFPRDPKRCSP
ncbi:hypothetical protein WA158_000503 [Blastocystis sp. Blastoise]